MQITKKKSGKNTILDLKGRLVLGVNLSEFRDAVDDVTGKETNIVLNMADVTCIDMRGIGELVNVYKEVTNRGGRMMLTNLPGRIRTLLDIVHLMKVFETLEGQEDTAETHPRRVTGHISKYEIIANPLLARLLKA